MKEEQFLLKVLNYFIHEKSINEIPQDISLNKLYYIGQKHNVTAIIFVVLENAFKEMHLENDDIVQKFRMAMFSTIFTAEIRKQYFQEIVKEFEHNKIAYVLLKGYQLKELYPYPDLRTMGDIDILVNIEDRDMVDAIFKKAGYQKEFGEGNVWTYKCDNIFFEIHTELVFETIHTGINYEKYFKNVVSQLIKIDDSCRRYIKSEEYFLYLVFHIGKHMSSSGAGIRMLMDLALYIQKNEDKLNWNYIQIQLEKIKLMTFTSYLFAFMHEFFQTPICLDIKKCDIKTVIEMREYILNGGIFGFERPESIRYLRQGITLKNMNNRFLIRCKACLKLVFPGRKYMSFFLPQVEKNIILLPIAWIIRLTHNFHNRKKLKKSFKEMSIDNMETAKRQYDLLNKIGLY